MKLIQIVIIFSLITTTLFTSQLSVDAIHAQDQISNQTGQTNLSENLTALPSISNNWYNVTGKWSLTEEALHGGTLDNTTSSVDNIVISPVVSGAPSNITTTFKIYNLDSNEPNSVSIIYSAVDPNNYRQAGINIYKDNIYVRFAEINNGSLTSSHPWPGVNTSMKFVPGSLFNMSLSLQNTTQSLTFNGSEFPYEGNNTFVDGYVGLKYGKIKDIDFNNFIVDHTVNGTENSFPRELILIDNRQPSPNQNGNSNNSAANVIVSDSQTILLEGESLPPSSFIHLYDSTPYKIIAGHVAAKLPCGEANSSDVNLLIGQAPNLEAAALEFVEPLSTSGDLCLYHFDITSNETRAITDIAIQNNGIEDIEFPDTSIVIVSVKEIAKLLVK